LIFEVAIVILVGEGAIAGLIFCGGDHYVEVLGRGDRGGQ
jgi:hypothetical protein